MSWLRLEGQEGAAGIRRMLEDVIEAKEIVPQEASTQAEARRTCR